MLVRAVVPVNGGISHLLKREPGNIITISSRIILARSLWNNLLKNPLCDILGLL